MIMFERFTDCARKVITCAKQEAERLNHTDIGSEHILLGLVKEGSGVGAKVLKSLNVDLSKVRHEVERLAKRGPNVVTMVIPLTPEARMVTNEYAPDEARKLNHNYTGTAHLLLGLLRNSEFLAAKVLMGLGINLGETRTEVLSRLLAADNDAEVDQEEEGDSRFEVFSQLLCFDQMIDKLNAEKDEKVKNANVDKTIVETVIQIRDQVVALMDQRIKLREQMLSWDDKRLILDLIKALAERLSPQELCSILGQRKFRPLRPVITWLYRGPLFKK